MPARPTRHQSSKPTPGAALTAAIMALSGDQVDATLKRERPWASITFSGTRHSIEIVCRKAADHATLQHLVEVVPDHEFIIPGHFVADLLITEQSTKRMLVEALTIIDPIEDSRG